MTSRTIFSLGALLLCIGGLNHLSRADDSIPAQIDFNRDVRPILSANCYFCHGPDKNKRKADLRLDARDGLFAKIEGHFTVVAGHPEKSELFRRVTAADPDERMPDPKSNKRLTVREIAVIKKWIEQGAAWEGHWAYLKPARVQAPSVSVATANPIDAFTISRMKEAGLAPADPADRATLIRRLYFDLLGLPPPAAEVEAFVHDERPGAYERLVDRLLENPHFGERMAVYWLDVVRYADSIGYHSDNPRNVFPYRDYVIRSFNQNKPFDQFTTEQLAGDLLPGSTLEQKVASAYNRLLQTTEEGGAQPKEYEAKYAADRVRNVSTAWMAATMGCCQCHDHKFDPFSMNNFYSMAAFFADVQEASVGRREPGMPVPDAEQAAKLQTLEDALAAAKSKLEVTTPELAAAQSEWESKGAKPLEWHVLSADSARVQGDSKLRREADGILRDQGKPAAQENFTVIAHTDLTSITGFRLEALDDPSLPAKGPGTAPNGNFVLTSFKVAMVNDEQKPTPLKLIKASADHSQETFPVQSAIDAKLGGGWAILPEVGKKHFAIQLDEPLKNDGGAVLVFTLQFRSRNARNDIGKFRLSVTSDADPADRLAPENISRILTIAADQRTSEQNSALGVYFRSISPLTKPIRDEIASAQKQRDQYLQTIPTCLVSVSAKPRVVRLLHRGNWMDDSGPEMSPAIPQFLLDGKPTTAPSVQRLTRLDLAHWLVSSNNPLTAHVFVNRLWKLYFGQGLSKVLDDVGSQGEWPTHPELLDWMACEFMQPTVDSTAAHAWDVKHMVRLIVTSNTYRESSKPSELDQQKDPYNRLLAHQARFRLDAEFVRDNALAVSGLLDTRVGGASVKPYQPGGYWDQLNFPTRQYMADKGQDEYRRGLYTWWQRSFLHPSAVAFDAPSREESVCERNRSNIPQQALVLLNDPSYVEAARVFAARIIHEGGATPTERLDYAFETALSRKPRAQEASTLIELFQKHLELYRQDVDAAKKLITTGGAPVSTDIDSAELAAWTSVARTILNLHETITRM